MALKKKNNFDELKTGFCFIQMNPVRDVSTVEKDNTHRISHAVRYADKYRLCCIPTACCLWLWSIFSTELKSLTGFILQFCHTPKKKVLEEFIRREIEN